MEAFQKACEDPENYKYALTDMPELLDAVAGHYQKRYGVHIERDEIMSVNGSQEGIAILRWRCAMQGTSFLYRIRDIRFLQWDLFYAAPGWKPMI